MTEDETFSIFGYLRKNIIPIAGIFGTAIAVVLGVEAKFDSLQDDIAAMELRLIHRLDMQQTNTVASRAGIIEAIDRAKESLSKEHQQGNAHVAQLLVSIAHDLGYTERIVHEQDRRTETEINHE